MLSSHIRLQSGCTENQVQLDAVATDIDKMFWLVWMWLISLVKKSLTRFWLSFCRADLPVILTIHVANLLLGWVGSLLRITTTLLLTSVVTAATNLLETLIISSVLVSGLVLASRVLIAVEASGFVVAVLVSYFVMVVGLVALSFIIIPLERVILIATSIALVTTSITLITISLITIVVICPRSLLETAAILAKSLIIPSPHVGLHTSMTTATASMTTTTPSRLLLLRRNRRISDIVKEPSRLIIFVVLI